MRLKSGFTLVEIAIVIVVLGLLVGGILAGQTLVEQAKITKTISQLREYDIAVNTFKAKYGEKAVPGDFDKANQFGIGINSHPGGNFYPLGNGDGDGVLESDLIDRGGNGANSEGYTVNWFSYEIANFFVVLSNSGLIKGIFKQQTRIGDPYTPNTIAGSAFPVLAVNSGMIAVTYKTKYAVNFVLAARTDNTESITSAEILYGLTSNFSNYDNLLKAMLTPEQAYSIDTKLDDGTPDKGSVVALTSYNNINTVRTDYGSGDPGENCADILGNTTVYQLDYKNRACGLIIKMSN